MPTYHVRCEDCNAERVVVHKITEDHPPCDSCDGKTITFIPEGTILPASMSNQRRQFVEERRTMKQLTRD